MNRYYGGVDVGVELSVTEVIALRQDEIAEVQLYLEDGLYQSPRMGRMREIVQSVGF